MEAINAFIGVLNFLQKIEKLSVSLEAGSNVEKLKNIRNFLTDVQIINIPICLKTLADSLENDKGVRKEILKIIPIFEESLASIRSSKDTIELFVPTPDFILDEKEDKLLSRDTNNIINNTKKHFLAFCVYLLPILLFFEVFIFPKMTKEEIEEKIELYSKEVLMN